MSVYVAYLVSPLVNDGHVDIINKHCHFLACWWTIGCAHSLVHIALDSTLGQSRDKNVSDKKEKISILVHVYSVDVVVQFYPWFKFYFPLFQTHYHALLYIIKHYQTLSYITIHYHALSYITIPKNKGT